MNLYTITDAEDHDEMLQAWWCAAWAASEQQAIKYANDNYGGDQYCFDAILRVVSEHKQGGKLSPSQDGTHYETREEVLRLAGWRYEGENECEGCGLHANGIDEHYVCGGCNLCPECYEQEDSVDCEDCHP